MRLNRLKRYKMEKGLKKRIIIYFFIVIPLISIILGYFISRVIIAPNFK